MGSFTYFRSQGGIQELKFTGSNLFVTKVTFVSQTPGLVNQSMQIPVCKGCNEQKFSIPFSVLVDGVSYGVYASDECGRSKHIAYITVLP